MSKLKKMVIVDYGVGNFRNVQKAFQKVGADVVISDQIEAIDQADAVILPGVGAFGDAIDHVRARKLEAPMLAAAKTGKPFFGICVGLQLLFETSSEMGHHTGLGLLPGYVTRFAETLTVPHMGWNQIEPVYDHPLMANIQVGDFAYFAHSYHCVPANEADILAKTHYGDYFVSAVAHDNIYGIQFHPEKSQKFGLQILDNFTHRIV